MPMNTQILRNGHPTTLRWGWWHLEMIQDMTTKTLSTMNEYVIPYDMAVCDPDDREEFFLYEGDVLRAWYSSR